MNALNQEKVGDQALYILSSNDIYPDTRNKFKKTAGSALVQTLGIDFRIENFVILLVWSMLEKKC